MGRSQSFPPSLAIAALFAAAAILGLTSSDPRLEKTELPSIEWELWIAESDEQRDSMALRSLDDTYRPFSASRFSTARNFAYLWIRLSNAGSRDREIILSNHARNYYTELLEPDPLGAATFYRQGDIVPVSRSPLHHNRTAFPIIVAAESTLELVIEYHGPRGIIVEPEFMSPADYLAIAAFERGLAGFVYGSIVGLLILNAAAGILAKRRYLFAAAVFIASICLFSLRQSRILLLLIDPAAYPEWLHPVTIALNLVAAMYFARSLLNGHIARWQSWAIRGIVGSVLALAALSFVAMPYLIADGLNLLSLGALGFVLVSLVRGVKRRDRSPPWILPSFIPWLATMVADILLSFLGIRGATLTEYRQAFGLLATLVFLSLSLLRSYRLGNVDMADGSSAEAEGESPESGRQLAELTSLRSSILRQVGHRLRQPIDAIVASARILERGNPDPHVAAASRAIMDEAKALMRGVEDELSGIKALDGGQGRGADEDEGRVAAPIGLRAAAEAAAGFMAGRVCIYDDDAPSAARKSLILRAEGFEIASTLDHYQILLAAAQGAIDVLVVDPGSVGEQAFTLCALLRESHSMLELPILMITNTDADYAAQKGYAAGINDSLKRPFDASELAARVTSLARLRQVASHNADLTQSEKEKNAFLYFLTHNINTPLTIILNRVRELEGRVEAEELPEIAEDLSASALEINDIVQNVLIAFRLADGRQILRLEELDLAPILGSIERELRKRAEAKGQSLRIEIPERLPAIRGDRAALRGVIYNLVDNAIKFSPRGGSAELRIGGRDPLRIEVWDTGPGIPIAERNRLFGRWERLSPKPTAGESSLGLGLHVAHELAKMGGGSLTYADGAPGACFVLSLPAYRPIDGAHAK